MARLAGVQPVRFFAVLLPLWRLDVAGRILDRRAYQLIERFLERGIADAGLTSADELAGFFGLDPALVQRVLTSLDRIGHFQRSGSGFALSDLGERSVREEQCYETKEHTQHLYLDGLELRPLPKEHYAAGDVPAVLTPAIPTHATYDGTRFQALPHAPFQPDAVRLLVSRPDRDRYNVPPELRDVSTQEVAPVYYPVYLVEAMEGGASRVLGFSRAPGDRDEFVERLCQDSPLLRRLLDAEESIDVHALWTRWLDELGEPSASLRQLRNGIWRATLPATTFEGAATRFRLARLGSFEVRQRYFVQLWCGQERLRRRAVLERGAQVLRSSLVRTRQDLASQLGLLSRQLEVADVGVDALRGHVERERWDELAALLDALPDQRPAVDRWWASPGRPAPGARKP